MKNHRYKYYNIGLVDHVIFSSNNYQNHVIFSVKWAFIIFLSVVIDSPLKKKKSSLASVLKKPKSKTNLALDSGNKDISQTTINLTISGEFISPQPKRFAMETFLNMNF